jgi:ankyrin repeat protein
MKRESLEQTLIGAVVEGDFNKVQNMLKAGVDVDSRDREHGDTALMLSLRFGFGEIAQILLEHGADVEARNDEGRSVLSLAPCVDKRTGAVSSLFQSLLASGADINSVDAEGRSVLAWQMMSGIPSAAVEFLLSEGADPALADECRETALTLAEDYGFTKAAELMRQTLERKKGIDG